MDFCSLVLFIQDWVGDGGSEEKNLNLISVPSSLTLDKGNAAHAQEHSHGATLRAEFGFCF